MMTFPKFLAYFVEDWDQQRTVLASFIELEEQLRNQKDRRYSTVKYATSWHQPRGTWERMIDLGLDFCQTQSHASFDLFWDEVLRTFPFLENERRYALLARG